jgi:hypothetical protein
VSRVNERKVDGVLDAPQDVIGRNHLLQPHAGKQRGLRVLSSLHRASLIHPGSTAAALKPEVKTHRKTTFSTASREFTPITSWSGISDCSWR